jgi:hypothetical protein
LYHIHFYKYVRMGVREFCVYGWMYKWVLIYMHVCVCICICAWD